MKLSRAILAGALGTVLVVILVYLAGMVSHRHADLCELLGSSITGVTNTWTWILGGVGQLIVGIVASIVYAAIFEFVTQRAGAVAGFTVALGHVVVAGLAVGFLPATRLIQSGAEPPGAFMEYRGTLVVVAFVVAHLAFGTLIGALYGRPRHASMPRSVVWREVEGDAR